MARPTPSQSPPARRSPRSSARPSPSLAWREVVSSLPHLPGVYWFIGAAGEVLYVGKAKNLKNRVSSYTRFHQLQARTQRLVGTAQRLKFEILESELEALLVEAELIRIHHPPFNIALKDDKSDIYIQITDEPFPRVLQTRKRVVIKGLAQGQLLGPFSSGYRVKEVLNIARKIFPWCNKRPLPSDTNAISKACFYHHIGQCPGACVGKISIIEYRQAIDQLTLFLKGKKKEVIRDMKREMQAAADAENFERAAFLRDSLNHIEAVTGKNYRLKPEFTLPQLSQNQAEEGIIHLRELLCTYLNLPRQYPLERIECYDVSNTQGTNPAVAMVTFSDGRADPAEYRLFNIRTLNTPNDFAMLREALQRRQNHAEWGLPNLLVIDGGKGQLRTSLLSWYWPIPMISLAKDPDRIIIPGPPLLRESEEKRQAALTESTLEREPHKKIRRKADTDDAPKYYELKLPSDHPGLRLLQQLRDEAHRFSKKQHSKLRTKNLLA